MNKKKPSKLAQALLEAAGEMRAAGLLDKATHEKIALQHLGPKAAKVAPTTGTKRLIKAIGKAGTGM